MRFILGNFVCIFSLLMATAFGAELAIDDRTVLETNIIDVNDDKAMFAREEIAVPSLDKSLAKTNATFDAPTNKEVSRNLSQADAPFPSLGRVTSKLDAAAIPVRAINASAGEVVIKDEPLTSTDKAFSKGNLQANTLIPISHKKGLSVKPEAGALPSNLSPMEPGKNGLSEQLPYLNQEEVVITANNTTTPKLGNLADRLTVLEAQIGDIQNQVTQFGERMSLVEERLIMRGGNEQKATQQEAQESEDTYSKIGKRINQLRHRIGDKLFVIYILSAIIILFLLVYIIFPRRIKSSYSGNYDNSKVSIKEPEFNPLEGQEGLGAKLNLARAYVEMGKNMEAKNLLDEILAYGDALEQEEAKTLLEKIKIPN